MFGDFSIYEDAPVAKAEYSAKQIKAAADVLRTWQKGNVSAETIFEEAVAAADAIKD